MSDFFRKPYIRGYIGESLSQLVCEGLFCSQSVGATAGMSKTSGLLDYFVNRYYSGLLCDRKFLFIAKW